MSTWDDGNSECYDDEAENAAFARAVASLAPPVEYGSSVQEALAAVRKAIQRVFGSSAWVLPYGSLVQGAHLLGSDLDLAVDVPGLDIDAVGIDGKPDNTQQVAALRRLMRNLPWGFRLIEQRLWKNIKVPIIILGHTGSKRKEVETDISIGVVYDGVEKGLTDRLIRRVFANCPRALHTARLIKIWAKAEGINKAYDGFLNSLGWTLLVIYFFMQIGEVTSNVLEQEEENERGSNNGYTLPPPLDDDPDRAVPSFEEIADFFEFVAKFEEWPDEESENAWCVSVVDGSMVQVPATKKVYADNSDFFLEDPGPRVAVGRSENVARSLRKNTWSTTLNKCREAADSLREVGAAAEWIATIIAKAKLPSAPQVGNKRLWEAPAAQQPAKRFKGNGGWQQPQQQAQPPRPVGIVYRPSLQQGWKAPASEARLGGGGGRGFVPTLLKKRMEEPANEEEEELEVEVEYDIGDIVEGYWPDDDTWLPANVVAKRPDGMIEIEWAEDESKSIVPMSYVRHSPREQTSKDA